MSLRGCSVVPVTGTARALIVCQRSSAFWGLGCPKTHSRSKTRLVPLAIAHTWRKLILRREHGDNRLADTIKLLQPASLLALLVTLVLLFGFQGGQILALPYL